nr:unnamed protein product [Callosobruchus analis]
MKKTKKHRSRTLPSIGRVSSSSITKILMPVTIWKSLVRNAYDPPNLHVYGVHVSLKQYLHHIDDLQLIIIEQKSLFKYYPSGNLNVEKTIFNKRLTRIRVTIERAFVILSNK